MIHFSLGGVAVPIECFATFSQRYEKIESSSILRMMNGAGVKQTAWSGKLRVITEGSGWAPLGLTGLDFSAALALQCAIPLALDSASNVIALPAARRTDAGFTPIGFAVVNDELVETPLSIVTDTATLTTVAGATAYRVHYWPEISVFVTEPPQTWDQGNNSYNWSFTAEEV